MKPSITLNVNEEIFQKIADFYKEHYVENHGEYISFMAVYQDVQITGYTSKKGKHKVTFIGELALQEAQIWNPEATLSSSKITTKEEWEYFGNQIGSDEVGVGDFLAPMVVVAAYVKKEQIALLKELGIHDSKKLNDQKILELGPAIIKEFDYSLLVLPNEKYNEMIAKGENLNSLKAKMHNRALLNMHRSHPEVINIFIDEFVKPSTYYHYLNDEKEEIVGGIISKTKGESHYPCVALASVIARFFFLKEISRLENKYGMSFPLGTNKKALEAAKTFINKYGIEEFDKIAKKNFTSYREITATKLF